MKRILSLLLIGSSSLLLAQSAKDTKAWIGIKANYSLSEKLNSTIGIQHRSKNNFKDLDKYFLEGGFDYDLSNQFSIETGLRLEKSNDTSGNQQGIENKYRLHADLNFNQKFGDLKFKSRVRYQINNEFKSQQDGAQTLRFKNSIELKIDRWEYDPEFLIEPFITVGDPNFSGVRKWRYGISTDIKLVKGQKLKVAYFYMTSTQYLERQHIVGLFYKFDLN